MIKLAVTLEDGFPRILGDPSVKRRGRVAVAGRCRGASARNRG